MAKLSKTSGRFTPEQVQLFLQQGEIKTMSDVQCALNVLFGQTLQAMLEGEMDHHLGYEKHGRSESLPSDDPDEALTLGERVRNRCNGHNSKSIRVMEGKSLFPNDESLLKMLYLTTCDVQREWTMRIAHWGQILAQLTIVYPDRVKLTN